MRILVYGFKPYGHYTENVTERLIGRLPARRGIVKNVFDVRFDAAMFEQVLASTSPDVIIGLGQHPRARKLRIERKAQNRRGERGNALMPIQRDGPKTYFATLEFPQTAATTVTYDAGVYVCNFSMYVMARYCARTGARFGFIHVPKDYSVDKLVKYIERVIEKLLSSKKS